MIDTGFVQSPSKFDLHFPNPFYGIFTRWIRERVQEAFHLACHVSSEAAEWSEGVFQGSCGEMFIPCCCSAGVGRTGVFITLSIVLERMRYEGAVDIFQTVKMLRTQRPAMVQTEVNTQQIHKQEERDASPLKWQIFKVLFLSVWLCLFGFKCGAGVVSWKSKVAKTKRANNP